VLWLDKACSRKKILTSTAKYKLIILATVNKLQTISLKWSTQLEADAAISMIPL
jgi:hypothetical protein